jgi:hypothetical protein
VIPKESLVQARMQHPAKIIPDAMKAIQALSAATE